MSVQEQEHHSGQVSLPEVELPEFKASGPVLSKWERFKRYFDQEWRPTMVYAIVVNIILLIAILALVWVSVAYGGIIFNPPTMLGLFSLPILLAAYDCLRSLEQEEEYEKERESKNKEPEKQEEK